MDSSQYQYQYQFNINNRQHLVPTLGTYIHTIQQDTNLHNETISIEMKKVSKYTKPMPELQHPSVTQLKPTQPNTTQKRCIPTRLLLYTISCPDPYEPYPPETATAVKSQLNLTTVGRLELRLRLIGRGEWESIGLEEWECGIP